MKLKSNYYWKFEKHDNIYYQAHITLTIIETMDNSRTALVSLKPTKQVLTYLVS